MEIIFYLFISVFVGSSYAQSPSHFPNEEDSGRRKEINKVASRINPPLNKEEKSIFESAWDSNGTAAKKGDLFRLRGIECRGGVLIGLRPGDEAAGISFLSMKGGFCRAGGHMTSGSILMDPALGRVREIWFQEATVEVNELVKRNPFLGKMSFVFGEEKKFETMLSEMDIKTTKFYPMDNFNNGGFSIFLLTPFELHGQKFPGETILGFGPNYAAESAHLATGKTVVYNGIPCTGEVEFSLKILDRCTLSRDHTFSFDLKIPKGTWVFINGNSASGNELRSTGPVTRTTVAGGMEFKKGECVIVGPDGEVQKETHKSENFEKNELCPLNPIIKK